MMMHHQSLTAPLDIPMLHPSTSFRTATPRRTLPAVYATYVVRVHTRHGIKTISFDVLAAFFTYTAKKAAEDLGISSRTLIRVCRSLGIRRWPYLGFRSEKNVERIRQEAIENLRRKLEREGSDNNAISSTVHPTLSCLRGASAKRLLQVKLPEAAAKAQNPRWQGSFALRSDHSNHFNCTSPSTVHLRDRDDSLNDRALPILTPPPTQRAFDLGNCRSLSPQRFGPPSSMVFNKPHYHSHRPTVSSRSMPPPSVLMKTPLLSAFQREVNTHLTQLKSDAYPRTMSMRDILFNSTPVA